MEKNNDLKENLIEVDEDVNQKDAKNQNINDDLKQKLNQAKNKVERLKIFDNKNFISNFAEELSRKLKLIQSNKVITRAAGNLVTNTFLETLNKIRINREFSIMNHHTTSKKLLKSPSKSEKDIKEDTKIRSTSYLKLKKEIAQRNKKLELEKTIKASILIRKLSQERKEIKIREEKRNKEFKEIIDNNDKKEEIQKNKDYEEKILLRKREMKKLNEISKAKREKSKQLLSKLQEKGGRETRISNNEDAKVYKSLNMIKSRNRKETISNKVKLLKIDHSKSPSRSNRNMIGKKQEYFKYIPTMTSIYEKVQKDIEDIKESERMKSKEMIDLKKKMYTYAKFIKDHMVIKADDQKSNDLIRKISILRHPVLEKKDVKNIYTIDKIFSDRTLKMSRIKDCSNSRNNSLEFIESNNMMDKNRNNFLNKAIKKENINEVNFREQIRKKRLNKLKAIQKELNLQIKNEIDDPYLNIKKKYDKIAISSKLLEENAEELSKLQSTISNGIESIDLSEKISSNIYNAINAKLNLLSSLT